MRSSKEKAQGEQYRLAVDLGCYTTKSLGKLLSKRYLNRYLSVFFNQASELHKKQYTEINTCLVREDHPLFSRKLGSAANCVLSSSSSASSSSFKNSGRKKYIYHQQHKNESRSYVNKQLGPLFAKRTRNMM